MQTLVIIVISFFKQYASAIVGNILVNLADIYLVLYPHGCVRFPVIRVFVCAAELSYRERGLS